MKKVIFPLCLISILSLLITFCSSAQEEKGKEEKNVKIEKPKYLWFDSEANFKRFSNKDSICYYLDKAKDTGFNTIVVDVRSTDGLVNYKSKFMKESRPNDSWDYLQFFIEESKKRELKVCISSTIFLGGRPATQTGVVYEDPWWDGKTAIEYTPEGMKDIRNDITKVAAFLNPALPEVQEYCLKFIRELLTNYKFDSLVLDYCRYSGIETDFSDYSRKSFEAYIGEKVPNFPTDIFTWKKNKQGSFYTKDGKYASRWYEYRAKVIHDFIGRVKQEIKDLQPAVKLEYWAASWHHVLYRQGQNWGSAQYDPSKKYSWASPHYKDMGFAEYLDVFMNGAYLRKVYGKDDPESMEYAFSNGRKIVGDQIVMLGSIYALLPELMGDAAYLALTQTDGLVVFDIMQVIRHNLWDVFKQAIIRAETNSMISKQDGKITLNNKQLSLSFADGKAFQFLDMKQGDTHWLPDGGMPGAIWKLTLKGPDGVNPQPTPFNGVYEGVTIKEDSPERATLAFNWRMRLFKNVYYPVRVLVSMNKGSELAEWNIETDVPANWKVTQVEFPCITVKRQETATAILPFGWGAEYLLSGGATYKVEYPSCRGAMQMICMQQNNTALYYATHDPEACIKNFKISGTGNTATLTTDVITSESWTPDGGGTFRLPWSVSVGISPKGWEDAAVKWYKPFTQTTIWGNKSLASRNLPQWVMNADMWLRPHYMTEETVSSLMDGIKYFGPETACHWYQWHQIEYDTDYPEYFPPRDGFVSTVKEVQKTGVHVVPYINGRLWDPASESYKRMNGKEASCRKENGTLYTEIYGSMVSNTITCPSSDIWSKIIQDLTGRIQDELGVNGIYIDQVGAAVGVPCWAANHPHAPGGGDFWHHSYRSLLEKVRANLRPDNILITEENAECFIDLFDVMLMVNSPQATDSKLVPLFPLIYSDRVIMNCFLYYPQSEKVNSMTFRFKNMLCLLWGAQLGWIEPQLIMAPEAKAEAEFLHTLVDFRKKQHDLIYGGTFVKELIPEGDNPIIDIAGIGKHSVVRGSVWQSSKGAKALLLVNMDTKPHLIEIPGKEKKTIKAAECMRVDL